MHFHRPSLLAYAMTVVAPRDAQVFVCAQHVASQLIPQLIPQLTANPEET